MLKVKGKMTTTIQDCNVCAGYGDDQCAVDFADLIGRRFRSPHAALTAVRRHYERYGTGLAPVWIRTPEGDVFES